MVDVEEEVVGVPFAVPDSGLPPFVFRTRDLAVRLQLFGGTSLFGTRRADGGDAVPEWKSGGGGRGREGRTLAQSISNFEG